MPLSQDTIQRIKSLIQQGLTNKLIAQRLTVSADAVMRQRRAMMGLEPAAIVSGSRLFTEDEDDLIRKMVREGYSYAIIGERLNRSRNSVIGRGARLGLTTKTLVRKARAKRPQLEKKPSAANWRTKEEGQRGRLRQLLEAGPVPSTDDADIPVSARVKHADLENNSCRWPLGDPREADFGFCPASKVPGLPYCEAHSRRAFQPPAPRKPRDYHRGKIANIEAKADADA